VLNGRASGTKASVPIATLSHSRASAGAVAKTSRSVPTSSRPISAISGRDRGPPGPPCDFVIARTGPGRLRRRAPGPGPGARVYWPGIPIGEPIETMRRRPWGLYSVHFGVGRTRRPANGRGRAEPAGRDATCVVGGGFFAASLAGRTIPGPCSAAVTASGRRNGQAGSWRAGGAALSRALAVRARRRGAGFF